MTMSLALRLTRNGHWQLKVGRRHRQDTLEMIRCIVTFISVEAFKFRFIKLRITCSGNTL